MLMLDNLPNVGSKYNQNEIVSLDQITDMGTYWVAYNKCIHFVYDFVCDNENRCFHNLPFNR